MGWMRIRILNFDADENLICALDGILRNAAPYQFQVTTGPLQEGILIPGAGNLEKTDTDLAILCCSGKSVTTVSSHLIALRKRLKEIPIVLALESAEFQGLCGLLDLGASDFLVAPFRAADLIPRLWRLQHHALAGNSPVYRIKEALGLHQFIGESDSLLQEIRKIPKIAGCDASVLVGGETGTGKEMVARAIHYLSPRAGKPFVPVNCGAIPADLVENELFGHEAGAFTGAVSSAPGLVQESNGGTLFLDEVDSLPCSSQVKILRLLQEKEYRPLGARKICKADVRIIAASNGCFENLIQHGKFRPDLFYRLNVISLSMPPLRNRKDDIPLLARHLVAKYSREYARPAIHFSEEALLKLIRYHWPGNVRELENIVAGAVVLSDGHTIRAEEIHLPSGAESIGETSFKTLKARAVAEFETSYIRQLLIVNNGNITKAASAAKKNRRAFWQLMHKHRITPPPAAAPPPARTNLSPS